MEDYIGGDSFCNILHSLSIEPINITNHGWTT